MSAYAPGTVAMITADNRPEPYRAFFDGHTWRAMERYAAFCVDTPTGIRPLVVLDLNESVGKGALPTWLRNNVYKVERGSVKPTSIGKDMEWLADQIEAQTKPPRIPEPGLWGVVEASVEPHGSMRVRLVRDGDMWEALDFPGTYSWSYLIDPTLIREGVES